MLVKRGKLYYARFQFAGRETWISTHQTNERKAKHAHDKLEIEFKQKRTARLIADALLEQAKMLATKEVDLDTVKGMLPVLDAIAMQKALELVVEFLPSPPTTAQDLWDKYLSTNPTLKESTLTTKTQRYGKFMAWAGDRDCRDLPETDCRKFLRSLSCSALTKNHYISELSSVFRASPDLPNPWGEHLRESATVKHKKPFLLEEIRKIRDYCVAHNLKFWSFAVPFAYYAGGRRLKEVVFLNMKSVNETHIDLLPNKTSSTGQRVRIRQQEKLRELMDTLSPDANGYYFPEEVKKYNSDRSRPVKEFADILKATGLYTKNEGFHRIRHTFVTEGIDAGIKTENIQATAGQNSLKITLGTYYHGIKDADISALPDL